jgi:DNA adenine methylase
MSKPFLKWVGGKTQILDTVLGFFPKEINNYYEPFLGGGSVLIELLSLVKAGRIHIHDTIQASDINPWLIQTYQHLQQNVEEVLKELAILQKQYQDSYHEPSNVIQRSSINLQEAMQHPENYYYWIRKKFNEMCLQEEFKHSYTISAMFIFLNKTGFRGIYREGPNGYNVPYGHYKNLEFYNEHHLRNVSEIIQPVKFYVRSFEAVWDQMIEGDFIYLDPPYAPEKYNSFVGYTTDGFDIDMHEKLFRLTKQLVSRKIRFLMSNADVSMVRNAFPSLDFVKRVIVCRRAIHSKDPSSTTNELLIQPQSQSLLA